MSPSAHTVRQAIWTLVWAAVATSLVAGSRSVVILTTLLVAAVALWDEMSMYSWPSRADRVDPRPQTYP